MFIVEYIKDGQEFMHDYKPGTKEEALGVGHELTRDGVADYFRVRRGGVPVPPKGTPERHSLSLAEDK